MLSTSASATATATSTPAPVVTAATLADLASQTASQASSGAAQFQITLNPEGLGEVSVTVNVGAEGKVSAAFAFEKPETADALSDRASDLQKSLEQAGFSLSDAGLTFAVATPTDHAQNAGGAADQGGRGADFAQTSGGGPGHGSGQGSGQNGGQGGQGSGQAFTQNATAGSGYGSGHNENAGQGQSWTYGQTAGRAFASANDAAAAADRSPASPYASRSSSGLDIRI